MRDRLIELHEEAGSEWNAYLDNCLDEGKETEMTYDDFIADYLLANGVVVPPVNIGETVYYIFSDSSILELKVASIEIAPIETFGIVLRCYGGVSFYERDIGKTVFFTKEEAERALKGGEQG